MTDATPVRFPDGFSWGVATASYQIEGAVEADGRRPSIWDTFSHQQGNVSDGSSGDVACDHYHRYREDVDLIAGLGVGTYRFSLAWPRLQPDGRGPINQAGLDFYLRLLDALQEKGIRPWVTLYHWDLPQALEDAGGWPARDTVYRFADYATAVYERLHDRVADWTTLNEPWCSAYLGYGIGQHAPGVRDPRAALHAAHHLLLGHGLAVRGMRAVTPETTNRFGITLNLWPVSAATDLPGDLDAARRVDGISNRAFLDPLLRGSYPDDVLADVADITDTAHIQPGDTETIAAPIDVLGINYYSPTYVRQRESAGPAGSTPWVGCEDVESVPQGFPTTDMGWEIEPDGLRRLLVRLRDDYPPIPLYVTENGMAVADVVDDEGKVHDPERIGYLDGHLRACRQAMDEGVDLRGYFAWTLYDNFEWSFGYSKRFGVVYLDTSTQVRIPKSSAAWYAQVARTGELP
ncbi:beta-glucosidase [Actinopolymorpha cephalotaxi]|uniref:Beta-glucosidase n=1 Tax=Actinopolymorpha cephalotaxi TaxID=504797 RepID=A0A1I2WF16_9ACTN|nr:GH1 family beta-glucosidase [Actinopolymorpha cephalotaxi]NYH82637.1 beta-glucosidase [Actinopolymorpha cephalotaxi]SFG99247.1 beta-glucosidase [Actinopolymorpha cephalotaxi]